MARMELKIDALKRLRLAAGLTQAQLAELAGLSETTLNQLETGRTEEARISTVRKLASALDCGIADIAQLPAESEVSR